MLKAGDLAHRVRGVKRGRTRRDRGISHVWGMIGKGVQDHLELTFCLERVTLCMRAKHKNELCFVACSRFAAQH